VRKTTIVTLALFGACVAPALSMAAGVGEGGCVTSPTAPVYSDDVGEKVIATKEAGECVAGITIRGGILREPAFHEASGRLRVQYFAGKDAKGMPRIGWMQATDIQRFTYECGCGSNDRAKEDCTAFSGGFVQTFNPCFKAGRDKVMSAAASPAPRAAAPSGGESLQNEDVVSLVKVGLDDALIISKIKSAKTTRFDLSTAGLVALKKANVSNAVLDAMMKRTN